MTSNGEAILALIVWSLMMGGTGFAIGGAVFAAKDCPAPDYDVDRVVKMHEESRKCAAELEEAHDSIRICGRLLKGALE